MILTCPACSTRYVIQAHMFVAGPRPVRCARCKHGWRAEPPTNIEVVGEAPPEPTPIPESIVPIPNGSNLPVVTEKSFDHYRPWLLAGGGILGMILLMWLILDRQHIARKWTSMEPIYNAVGLYIYYPGDGLEFDQVRSELKFDGGITKLFLDGKIKNTAKNNQKVPNIVAEALGSDGQIIQSWQIDAPVPALSAGQETSFTSAINAPKSTVVNINLNFVEMKDDN